MTLVEDSKVNTVINVKYRDHTKRFYTEGWEKEQVSTNTAWASGNFEGTVGGQWMTPRGNIRDEEHSG